MLTRAAMELAAMRGGEARPTVLLVGEIYVRCVPFANDFTAERLSQRGLQVRLAPIQELLEYFDHNTDCQRQWFEFGGRLSTRIQARIRQAACAAIDTPLGWPRRHTTPEILDAARPYLRDALEGEAVLTLGTPLLAWQHGEIDGVVSAGPHECMPNKIAESQFFHLAEREGLPSLTLSLNGEPSDPEVLDNFAFEVHARFRERQAARHDHGTRSGLAVGADMRAGNRNTSPASVAK